MISILGIEWWGALLKINTAGKNDNISNGIAHLLPAALRHRVLPPPPFLYRRREGR